MSDNNKYNLDIEQIEEIIDKGHEYGAYAPEDAWAEGLSVLEMATEIIDFAIVAWGEGIDENDEDMTVKIAGMQIKHLLQIAKVVDA